MQGRGTETQTQNFALSLFRLPHNFFKNYTTSLLIPRRRRVEWQHSGYSDSLVLCAPTGAIARSIAERDAQPGSWHRLDGPGALWSDDAKQAAMRLRPANAVRALIVTHTLDR